MYTDADQLRNKLDELQIQISLEELDFIFVTEVLPKAVCNLDCSSELYQIENYSSFPSSGDGRGVLIHAKSELNVSPNAHTNSFFIMTLLGVTGLLKMKWCY